jgi:hypothetical protein
MSKHKKPAYAYRRDAEGVDDLWIVYRIRGRKNICEITFWDDCPGWMDRAKRNAELVTKALNLYAEKHKKNDRLEKRLRRDRKGFRL